jgi:hypothetical protein
MSFRLPILLGWLMVDCQHLVGDFFLLAGEKVHDALAWFSRSRIALSQ